MSVACEIASRAHSRASTHSILFGSILYSYIFYSFTAESIIYYIFREHIIQPLLVWLARRHPGCLRWIGVCCISFTLCAKTGSYFTCNSSSIFHVKATLQVKYEPALALNVKEMQHNAIHLRHPGCRLANQTSKGLDDMLRAVQEAERSSK